MNSRRREGVSRWQDKRGLIGCFLILALMLAAIVLGVLFYDDVFSGPAPSPSIDLIETGDCVTATGPDNDLALTELPCDDPKAQYRVDVRTGIADVPCPSKSDVKVPWNVVVNGWYCLSSLR